MTVGSNMRRGRWLLPAAAFLLLGATVAPAAAQRVMPEVVPPPVGGTLPTVPTLPAAPDLRVVPVAPAAPQLKPAVPAVPGVPAPIIRFRCKVDPGASTCREPPLPDGGGDEDTCDCARDFCYRDAAGARVCEKS